MLEKLSKNVHKLYLKNEYNEVAVLSDLHWDNPKCDRVLLKKHLDYCLANNIYVVITGDLFCLMQGRGDNRRNKSDILPEHNNYKYLDCRNSCRMVYTICTYFNCNWLWKS